MTTGFRTPVLSTYVDLANDDHALNYFSPRFSGFEFGASYVPAATVNAGIAYSVGPGITASATVMWAEWDGEAADADGVGGIVGMMIGL